MQKRNLFVRIMAIVLCVIMLLGVVAVAFTAFAAEPSATVAAVDTGSADNTWIIIAVVAAILVVAACVVIPKLAKKK